MSVWVYKDGEKELIAPEFLDGQLEAGWSVTEGPAVEVVVEDEPVTETKPDIASGEIFGDNDQVRAAAKAAGIEGWDNKRIHTLKEMLG